MEHRVIDPKSSKARIFLVNQMLKQSIRPDKISLDRDLSKIRERMDNTGRFLNLAPGVFHQQQTIEGIHTEWLNTTNCNQTKCLLYFHGGGYAIGSPQSHRGMVSWLAKNLNIRVLTFYYRKAPEHPFPAAGEDALAIYQWLLNNGFNSKDIAFAGDSAGGGLVFSTLLNIKEQGLQMPATAVGISPWLDLTLSGASIHKNGTKDYILSHSLLEQYADIYSGWRERRHPLISPLFGDLSGLPPILLQVGTDEVLLDDSIRMMHKLNEAGVKVVLEEWQDMQHVWHYTSRFLSDGRSALKSAAAFMQQHL